MRLILLRHGETEWNKEKRLQGHDDTPLTERGIAQAKAIVPMIAQLKPAKVVASDLGRARQTAEVVGYPDAVLDPNLRELNMGAWTGLRKPDLIRDSADLYHAWRAGTYAPEGGEMFGEFSARIGKALRYWATQSDDSVLAVVHSGVVRAACHALLGLEPKHLLPVTQGTLTIFHMEAGKPAKLEAYNLGSFAPDKDVAD